MADRYDLVIAGTGADGATSAAAFAAAIGLRVALVLPPGAAARDPLRSVAALAASARVAHLLARASEFGLATGTVTADLDAVWRRVRAVAQAPSLDEIEAPMANVGVDVLRGSARLTGPNGLSIEGGAALEAKTILLCIASRSLALPRAAGGVAGVATIDGLFDLDPVPTSLTVVGGGPLGVAVAQATARLGLATTLLHRGPSLLTGEEPDLVAGLTERLRADGVDVVLGAEARRVTARGGGDSAGSTVEATFGGAPRSWTSQAVLIAVGGGADLAGLGLEVAGVEIGPDGVVVDHRGRTSVHGVYAVGAVAGRSHPPHAAAADAVQVVRDAFFPGRAPSAPFVPWCTLTDPELAHAGLTTLEAEQRHGEGVDVWPFDLARTDRARADGVTEGNLIIVTAKGRIVGAHVLAPGAGEVVQELALAIHAELKLADVAGLVHVQPTLSAAVGSLAAEAVSERAQKLRWLVRR